MKVPMSAVTAVMETVLRGEVRSASKILSPVLAVKATRRHVPSYAARTSEVVLTVGAPCYLARAYIKSQKRKGMPAFPMMMLKFYSVKKKRVKRNK